MSDNQFQRAMYYNPMDKVYSELRILILGHGGHGKDEFAYRFSDRIGLQFSSSSEFACESIVFPWFAENLPGHYLTVKQCFNDRRNWRAIWHKLISQYNTPDKSRLARDIMKENDVYVGMRCIDEYNACVKEELFTHIFWVDAGDRVEIEPGTSCTVEYDPDAMCMVDNSGNLNHLQEEVELAAGMLGF